MPERIDLHLHTTCSDGTQSPEAVVRLAKQAGLSAIAITDHDTVSGVAEATEAGLRLGIRVVPALELSVEYAGQDVHILAYFVDPSDPALAAMLADLRQARRERLAEMVGRLRRLGLPLAEGEVTRRVSSLGPVGRPHLAEALVARRWVETYTDAFRYYLSSESPAYLPNRTPSPEAALAVLKQAGGVPVLAHPGCYAGDDVLERFRRAGLMGIEVFHPRHGADEVNHLISTAERLDLLMTGGSDYHGEGRSDLPPGSVPVGADLLHRLEAARPVGGMR